MSTKAELINYLCDEGKIPNKQSSQFYDFQPFEKQDYGIIIGTQSHSRRRKMILTKYPHIAQLLQPSKPYSIIITLILIPFCMAVTYFVKDASWPVYLGVAYVIGGTYGHTLHVLIHDFTHYGGHKSIKVNKMMAILCNIPMGIPSALSFGKYHSDHHNYLGEQGKDPDLPTRMESSLSKNPIFKIFFWSILSVFYGVRPIVCYPNRKLLTQEVINYVVIFACDFFIYHYWGIRAILFLLIVCFLSIGPHPAALHVLAEHFEFVNGMQTYNYFGIWNFFNLNLGYHIEHHDFPTCPWYNLPKIRASAPQFYQNLPFHTSYTKLFIKFIFDKNFNLFNRTHRINKIL